MNTITSARGTTSRTAVYSAARTTLDAVRTAVHVLRAVAAGIRTFLGFFR